MIPAFVIFDRKTLFLELTKCEIPGTLYGLSANGWFDMKLLSAWFFDHFSPIPILLLLDGHASHYCPEVIRMAVKEKVIIFTNTTHLIQPLDRAYFSPLKVHWR